MRRSQQLARLSNDELWSLHLEIVQLLQEKIRAEQAELGNRLKSLSAPISHQSRIQRRPYPPVLPKYRNPDRPSETWSGRGKRPRWMVAQLKSGKRLDDFVIGKAANRR